MPVRRAHIYYNGLVQGVGFRYAAQRNAASLGLKGWVENLGDGRVEVLCEGPEREIEIFLEKINSIFKTHICSSDIEWGIATGEFEGFDIRFE